MTLKTSIIILAIDNHNKNPAMLAIKDLNNITRFENQFLPYNPVYLWTYDTCYDDAIYDENTAKFGYLEIQIPYLLTSKSGVLDTRPFLADGNLIRLHCKPEFL